MRSMGLSYKKASEGSHYAESPASGPENELEPGDEVAPGEYFVHKWIANDISVPTQGQISHLGPSTILMLACQNTRKRALLGQQSSMRLAR